MKNFQTFPPHFFSQIWAMKLLCFKTKKVQYRGNYQNTLKTHSPTTTPPFISQVRTTKRESKSVSEEIKE